jgi:hypothetical protein
LVSGASEDCSFLISVESDVGASHGASSFGPEKMESVSGFPIYESILHYSLCTSVMGFFWGSKNFFSQRRTCPSVEMVANWLISPCGWMRAEYDFFISI